MHRPPVLYIVFTDGQGKVYEYDPTNPIKYTSLFEYFEPDSHLQWVDGAKAPDALFGYAAGGEVYVLDSAPAGMDYQFDPSEYGHLTSSSIIQLLPQ